MNADRLGNGQKSLPMGLRSIFLFAEFPGVLTHFLGFKGVYLSEGIADLVAGVITTIVIFTSFPRIFKRRAEEVKAKA